MPCCHFCHSSIQFPCHSQDLEPDNARSISENHISRNIELTVSAVVEAKSNTGRLAEFAFPVRSDTALAAPKKRRHGVIFRSLLFICKALITSLTRISPVCRLLF